MIKDALLGSRKTNWNVFAALLHLGLLACTPQAEAQATGGGRVALTKLTFDERTASGKLQACELVYLIVYEDNIYRRGDPVFLRGALNLFDAGAGKGIGLGLKITMFDVVQDKPVLAPIDYAFLSANGRSYAGKEYTTGKSEDGGLLVGYDLLALPSLFEDLATGSIEINFNRPVGGSDVTVPVSLFEEHPKIALHFLECFSTLTESVERRLQ